MDPIYGRVTILGETSETGPVIRVDLRGYQLTGEQPYVENHLNYLRDLFIGKITHTMMLSQQIRRCPGVTSLSVAPYGCAVELGRLYEPKEVEVQIRLAVERTFTTRIPWTVHRGDNGTHWTYRFGEPLLPPDSDGTPIKLEKGKKPTEKMTDFGYQVYAELGHALSDIGSFDVSMATTGGELDWRNLDDSFEAIVAHLAGKQDVSITWEE
jgi:hypothetical protein